MSISPPNPPTPGAGAGTYPSTQPAPERPKPAAVRTDLLLKNLVSDLSAAMAPGQPDHVRLKLQAEALERSFYDFALPALSAFQGKSITPLDRQCIDMALRVHAQGFKVYRTVKKREINKKRKRFL